MKSKLNSDEEIFEKNWERASVTFALTTDILKKYGITEDSMQSKRKFLALEYEMITTLHKTAMETICECLEESMAERQFKQEVRKLKS